MRPHYNKIYWLKNFTTGEVESFSEDDERANIDYLKEKNEKEFNIYISVNTFLGNKRKNDELAEIKSCFIDLDYPEIKDFGYDEEGIKKRISFLGDKYRNDIIPKLREINNIYGIKPSLVNVTYKGLHILFDYSPECYFITPKIHEQINNILNEFLGGDKNARDVARVYKMLGFIDWKNGKKGHIKSLQLSQPNSEYIFKNISKDIIINKFGFTFDTRDEHFLAYTQKELLKKIQKQIIKSGKIKTNIFKINELDSFEIISKLQKYFENFSLSKNNLIDSDRLEKIKNKLKYKDIGNGYLRFYEENGINLTSGLFLVKNNYGYEIHDYSQRTRQNNYNFVKNWVLRGVQSDYNLFNEIIYYSTGITLNVSDEKKSVIDKKILVDFLNSRLILPNGNIKVGENNEDQEKTILQKFNYPESFSKIFIGFFHYLYKNLDTLEFDDKNKTYTIEVNKLLKEVFDISTKSSLEHNKRTLFDIIEIISNTKVDMEIKDVKIFSSILKSKKSNKDILIITPPGNNLKFKFGNPIYFNKNILTFQKGFKNVKATELLLFINGFLEISTNNLTYKLKDIYEFLGYLTENEKSKKSMLLKIMTKSKKLGIIKNFKIIKDGIIFSKYKTIK